jgi:integrase
VTVTGGNRRRQRQFGHIRRLPSGRWQASYLGPDGRRRSAPATFAAKADADAWLALQRVTIDRGEWRSPEQAREPFGEYGKRWLASRVDLRVSSAERYERLWRVWLEPTFADIPLGDMRTEHWRAWFASAMSSNPTSTAPGAAYRLARTILNTAVDDGLIPSNPCRIKGAGLDRSVERPVAMPEDVLRITSHLHPRFQPLPLLAAWCSFRFGELAGLRRGRIDLLHRTIRIEENAVELSSGRTVFGPPKTEAGRRVANIPAELVVALEAHLGTFVCPDLDALVFTAPEGGPLRRTKFRHKWVAACNAAGVSGLHFHDLRGSGATWAAHSGATVAELMARLGHTTPAMAMRYQHATLERDRALSDRLGALFHSAEVEQSQGNIRRLG